MSASLLPTTTKPTKLPTDTAAYLASGESGVTGCIRDASRLGRLSQCDAAPSRFVSGAAMPPITPVSTIPHPATISELLRELDVPEPWFSDPSRHERLGGDYSAYLEVAETSASSRDQALREIEQSEPRYLDPSRWARVAGEVVPLPPIGSLRMRIQANASALEAALADAAAKLEQFAQVVAAEAATSLENEDDAE